MLRGDITTTPTDTVLRDLAAEDATGCLHVVDDEGSEALVYVKSGLVYAVSVPGQRPQLGARLISSNALVPENLAEALEAQRTELQGWRLGELLVHLGFVEQDVVEDFVREQVLDGLTDLLGWTSGRWRFRKGEKTREDVAPPASVAELLDAVETRRGAWADIVAAVHGPTAVPMLAPRGGEADVTLDPDTWSVLCKIDGERSLAALARECGFTLFEAGTVVRALVEAGLVDVEEDVDVEVPALSPVPVDAVEIEETVDFGDGLAAASDDLMAEELPAEADDAGAVDVEFSRTAALAAAFAFGGDRIAALDNDDSEPRESRESRDDSDQDDAESVTADIDGEADSVAPDNVDHRLAERTFAPNPDDVPALARVSEALTRASGPQQGGRPVPFVDPFHVPDEIRLRPSPRPAPKVVGPSEEDLRRERIRQAAAAELAAAHAEAEALRRAQDERAAGRMAEVVNLESRREAARLEAERIESERLAAEETARIEAERLDAERVEAERLEAERVAAEEAARLEAERVEAERVAAEEAARLEAEHVAAEEAARLDAERLEAERLEAERVEAEHVAAEEAARLDAERLEAERLEAERVEAERLEAERLEAERIAAEEAARLEAGLEAERLAAEQQRYLAAQMYESQQSRPAISLEPAPEPVPSHPETDYGFAFDPTQVASASAMLSDFSRNGATVPVVAADEAEDEIVGTEDDEASVSYDDGLPPPIVQRDLTDTASLLRELSSLGFEDEPASGPSASRPGPATPRPNPAALQQKKKRGLFGR